MAASFQVPYAIDILAGTTLGLSALFYFELGLLLCGLTESRLNPEINIASAIGSFAIHSVAFLFLFFNGYAFAAMFVLPWILFILATNGMAILVKYEIVTIRNKDD